MAESGHTPLQNPPDWLPVGWTTEVNPSSSGKSVKCYIHQLTGDRFYSKPRLLEYLRTVNNHSLTPQKEMLGSASYTNFLGQINGSVGLLPQGWATETPAQENGSKNGKGYEVGTSEILQHGEMAAEKSPDWLPAGWTEEVKEKNGQIVKTYVDPLWGHRFYSKPQVLQYLGVVTNDSCLDQREATGNNSNSNLQGEMNETHELLPHESTLTTPWENGSQLKQGACEIPHSGQVVGEKTPDWLPAGWTEEVKLRNGRNVKCYIDSMTGRKFYSKPKVLKYLTTAKIDGRTSEKKNSNDFDINLPVEMNDPPESLPHGLITELGGGENDSEAGKSYKSPVKTIDSELPDGWITEVKHRKIGSSYKVYIDPVTGRKFFSKQKVFEYLGTVMPNSSTSRRKKTVVDNANNPNVDTSGGETPPTQLVESQSMKTHNHTSYTAILRETSSSDQTGKKVGKEHLSPQGLPPGWIKEFKNHKTRKIPYYIDPVSGYVFASLMDVWRYVEAGDISKCVVKPKKREEMGFTTDHSSPNVDKIVSNSPSHLLEGDIHVNMRRRTRFPPEDGKLSSSKQRDIEANVNKIVSNTPSQLLEGTKHVNTRKQTRSSPEDGILSSSKHRDSEPNVDKIISNTLSWLSVGAELVNKQKRTRYSPEDGNFSSSKQCDNKIMIERVAAKGLPSGWIKEIRLKIEKLYTDPGSGYVFMSQEDALCYLETGDIGKCAIKPQIRDEVRLNEGATPNTNRTGGGLPLLPASSQPKTNKTGGRLRLQHLEQTQNEYTPRLTRLASSQKETSSSKHSEGEIVVEKVTPKRLPPSSVKEDIQKKAIGTRRDTIIIERVPPEGLPPGWIKEIRIRKKADGMRRDVFYTDPVSGHVFSSQKDVLRYVETGDIHSCAMKPKTRDQLGLNQGSSDVSQLVVQKPVHDTNKTQLSTGKKSSSKRSLETIYSSVSQKRQTRSSVQSPAVIQKLEPETIKKQGSTDKSIGSKRSLGTMDIDVSPKRRQTRASASVITTKNSTVELQNEVLKVDNVIQKPTKAKMGTKNPTVELPKEVPKVGTGIQKATGAKKGTRNSTVELLTKVPKVDNVVQKLTKPKKDNGSSRSKLPKAGISMKKSGSTTSPKTVTLQLKHVKTAATKNSSKEKSSSPAGKTKKKGTKKETRTPPSRVSKRVLGLATETVPNSGSNERDLTAKVGKSRKKCDILGLNALADVASCEKALLSGAENPDKNEGIPCPNAPSDVASEEQALTTEAGNSGKDENIPCPNAPDGVTDNARQQLETVPEMRNTQVEKPGETEDIPCPNAFDYVTDNAPQQLETGSELDKTNHALGGKTEAPSDAEVSNKNNEATEERAEDLTVLLEQPAEVSSKSKKTVEDQTESLEQIAEVSNKSNEAREEQAEDQTVSLEQPAEVSNKSNETREEQAEDQTVSIQQPAEVSNKSKEAMEEQAEDQTVSIQQPAEVSKKSKEAMEEQADNQTISQHQPMYQFGEETWSDPCLDFEFKTLTGTLPFEDNAPVQNMFQLRDDTSQAKTADNGLTLLDFGSPNARQVSNTHPQNGFEALHQVDKSDAQNGSEPVMQWPTSPASLPDMNSSLPSGSKIAPQQVDSEENVKNDENVLTLDNYAKFLF